ncbi:DUF4194 domain-containing protein [Micrococcus sp.]|uniref:DUF4194 domain-containing protein n=1 Tax=Micrococcus sp. TaxID=1271 RepID=UPI002A916C00|nr:DUF4194 domain-containing protein [Micrococcus sp.]MDY6054517.1 DUF4194 domain-containing protein [Micrococcus sp.]
MTEPHALEPHIPEPPVAEPPAPEAHAPESPAEPGGFLTASRIEADPDACFPGDRGVLAPEVRRVLVRLLQRRVLDADAHPQDWAVLLEHRAVVESRLNDLFVRLVIDTDRGLAYKRQVRSDEVDVPILLKDDPYTRAETLVLVYLRGVYQRETVAGETAARVDLEEIEQTVLSYFSQDDGDLARRQRSVHTAVARLTTEGVVVLDSPQRYRITPLIEVVLSAERLRELDAWLREQAGQGAADTPDSDADTPDDAVADAHAQEGDAR